MTFPHNHWSPPTSPGAAVVVAEVVVEVVAAAEAGTGGTATGLTPAITKDTVPAAVVGGAKLHGALTVSLDNTGTAAEKGFTVNVYASTDTTLDTSTDTLVTSLTKPTTVNAEKTTSLSVPITELSASLDGTYYLIVQTVDSASNALSAVSSSTVVVSPPFVSLSEVLTTTLPTTLISDAADKGTVTVDITNNGNRAVVGSDPDYPQLFADKRCAG